MIANDCAGGGPWGLDRRPPDVPHPGGPWPRDGGGPPSPPHHVRNCKRGTTRGGGNKCVGGGRTTRAKTKPCHMKPFYHFLKTQSALWPQILRAFPGGKKTWKGRKHFHNILKTQSASWLPMSRAFPGGARGGFTPGFKLGGRPLVTQWVSNRHGFKFEGVCNFKSNVNEFLMEHWSSQIFTVVNETKKAEKISAERNSLGHSEFTAPWRRRQILLIIPKMNIIIPIYYIFIVRDSASGVNKNNQQNLQAKMIVLKPTHSNCILKK